MRRIVLDSTADSLDAVYDRLAAALDLGHEFGRNLDALWDVLTTDVAGPVEIVWRDHRMAERRLGADYGRLLDLFRDVERERADFRLVLA